MSAPNQHVCSLSGLVCGWDEPLLDAFDFEWRRGELVIVEGPNGIGKSTLIKTLAGLIEPMDGTFSWHIEPGERRYVPQVRTLDPVLPATVEDVLATGVQRGTSLADLRKTPAEAAISSGLSAVGLESRRGDLFRDLSEGQKQLVLLARALMGEPHALLLDEPTASMDPYREEHAVEQLRDAADTDDIAIMMIAHGSEAARQAADRFLQIDREGQVHPRAHAEGSIDES
jgi:ABC-type Mn2+/Zn2+ transport system ATPase subunit